jgi:hypothetical protein
VKISIRSVIVWLLFMLSLVLLGGVSSAAAPQQPKGITVSPAFQQVTVPAGSVQAPVKFTLTNNKSAPQNISLSVADFSSLNESGGLFFVGTNPTALQKKYGLAKWFSLPQKSLTLQPKQTVNINAEILNLPDLSPGGHYGALMISLGNGAAGDNSVGISPVASSLLFVAKLGGDTHKLGLADVTFSHSLFSLPGTIQLRFHNDGNTHLVPRGTVYITAPGGKVVIKGIINGDSGIILPQTFRRYSVPMQKIGNSNAAGKYQLHVDFRFDGIDQYRSYQASFNQLPIVFVMAVFVILALILAVGAWLYKKRHPKTKLQTKAKS